MKFRTGLFLSLCLSAALLFALPAHAQQSCESLASLKIPNLACAYPKVPKYKGTGDVNSAANFNCVDPR